MKYLVTKAFTDINTGLGYNPRSTFESDDLERVSFLAENCFIQAPSKTSENNNSFTSQDDDEQTVKELKVKAKELGIPLYSKMNKEELIVAIETAESVKASDQ